MDPHDEDASDDELDAEDVMDILQTMRAEWGAVVPDDWSKRFKCDARGGLWTAAHTGMAVDSIRAQCHSQAAKDWAKLYSLPLSATLSLRLYADEFCSILSQYWCHRMGHFFALRNVVPGAEPRVYSAVDTDMFVEPAEFSELATIASGALAVRIRVLRGFEPREPSP